MVKFTESVLPILPCRMSKIFAGVDVSNGQAIILDLDELPHILVAGTTGSGKSVMLNSIICSLLKTCPPYSVEFTMIDTKRVELSPYKQLNKELCRVATDSETGIDYLKDICDDIDARYRMMEKKGLRKAPENYYREIVIIEELGDLMYDSKRQIEPYIVKIARLGRACGIHLILCTQRPTVDVVTGEIKANIGCRFALQTTSYTDSMNILGHSGAELLKGKGDCLLKLPTSANELHIQCPYISDSDIDKIIKNYK